MNSININITKMKAWTMRLVLVAAVLGAMIVPAKATHIVGGDFTYRSLGNGNFEVTLTIRRDCFNGADDAQFDTLATVSIFDGNGALAAFPPLNGYLQIPFMGADTLDDIIISDCGFLGTQVCVHEAVYRDTLFLPDLGKGYILAYQRCCRNVTLNNIDDPLNTGLTEVIQIPQMAFDEPNSSPVFNEWPELYICSEQPFTFDHSATDPDGDELRYSLVTPYEGANMNIPMPLGAPPPPYQTVDWLAPFSQSDLLGGAVPLTINEITGMVSATPGAVGQYLVGIMVEEFRHGEKIGEVRRDFEYNVRLCAEPPMAAFDPPTGLCDGALTVSFVNQSTAAANVEWYFDWPNEDPAFYSTEENPTFTYPEAGTYTVRLKANRGTDACFDEFFYTFTTETVPISTSFKAAISECVEEGYVLTVDDSSIPPSADQEIVQWMYTFNQDGNIQTQEGSATAEFMLNPNGGPVSVTLDVVSSAGCEGTTTQDYPLIDILPYADFTTMVESCIRSDELELTFEDISSANNENVVANSWAWEISSSNGVESYNGQSVTEVFNIDEEITVSLYVRFNNGCDARIEKNIKLSDYLPKADFTVVASDCPTTSTVEVTFADNSNNDEQGYTSSSFNWNITTDSGVLTSLANPFSATINTNQTITVDYNVVFTNGCSANIQKEINVNDLLPQADFIAGYSDCPDEESIDLLLTDISASLNPDNLPGEYSWEVTTQDGVQSFNTAVVELTTATNQTITVSHDVTFANGCKTNITREINLLDLIPSASFSGNYESCPTDDNIDLTLSNTSDGINPGNNAASLQWTVVSQEGTFNFTGENIALSINPYQIIEVTLEVVFDDGCLASTTEMFNVEDLLPAANFTYSYEGCPDTDPILFTFSDDSNGADLGHPPVSWAWTVNSSEGTNTYSGSSFDITLDPNQSIEVILDVVFANGCEASINRMVDLTNELLMPDFGFSNGGCAPEDVIVLQLVDMSTGDNSVNPATAWSWTVTSNDGVSNLEGSEVSINLNSAETVTVLLEVTYENGCMLQVEKEIVLSELLPTTDIGFSTMGCASPELIDIVLTDLSGEQGNETPANAWTWTINSTEGQQTYNESMVNLSLDPYQTIEVTLEVVLEDGCIATTTESFNLEEELPQVSFTAALGSCIDDQNGTFVLTDTSADIDNNASTPVSQVWTINLSDATTINGTGQVFQFDANSSLSAEVTLETTFENGCLVSNTQQFNLEDLLPQAGYTYQPDLCADDATIDLIFTDASITPNGETVVDVVWEIGANGAQSSYVGSPVTAQVPKDEEIFVTQIVSFDNGCVDTLMNSFMPEPAATITFTGSPVVACAGSETPLVVDGNPDWTYTWEPSTGLDLSQGSHNPMFVGTEATTYNVTVTDGTCTVESSVEVQIGNDTELTVAGDMFSCTGMVDLTVSGGVGVGTYNWALATDPETIIYTGEHLVTTFAGDSVTYIITYDNEDCPGMPLEVTITSLFPDIDLLEPYMICAGDSVGIQVFNNDNTQVLTYQWEDDPHITGGQDTDTPIVELGENETAPFELPFTVSNQYGCVLEDTLNVVIADVPTLSFSSTLTECGELEMCFEVTSEIFGFAVWDFGDPNTTDDTALGEQVCYTYPSVGTYTVTLSNISGVCQAEPVMMDVTIHPEIEVTTASVSDICAGDEVTLSAMTNLDEFTAIWCNLNGDTLSMDIDYTFTANADEQIILKVADSNNCMAMDTIQVNTFDFDIDVQFPDVFCGMQEIAVSVINNSDGDLSYQWGPEDCVISGGDTAEPVLTATGDSKTFTVTVTDVVNGCTQEFSYDIPISDFNIEADAEPDAEIYLGDEVEIFVVDQMDDYTYEWDNGVTDPEQTVSPEETTTYTVTVTDAFGCTDTAQVTITVNQPQCDETDVYLPNAFSPNDDGVNDLLYVRSNYIESMFLIIYDRWGEEVFRSTDQNTPWDGTFNGEKLAPDAYAYILDVVCVNAVEYTRKGNVSIIR